MDTFIGPHSGGLDTSGNSDQLNLPEAISQPVITSTQEALLKLKSKITGGNLDTIGVSRSDALDFGKEVLSIPTPFDVQDFNNKIKEYQKSNGIGVDGIIGKETYIEMKAGKTLDQMSKDILNGEGISDKSMIEIKMILEHGTLSGKNIVSILLFVDRFEECNPLAENPKYSEFFSIVNNIKNEYRESPEFRQLQEENKDELQSFFEIIVDDSKSLPEKITKIALDPLTLTVAGLLFLFGVLGSGNKLNDSWIKRLGWIVGGAILGPTIWNRLGGRDAINHIKGQVRESFDEGYHSSAVESIQEIDGVNNSQDAKGILDDIFNKINLGINNNEKETKNKRLIYIFLTDSNINNKKFSTIDGITTINGLGLNEKNQKTLMEDGITDQDIKKFILKLKDKNKSTDANITVTQLLVSLSGFDINQQQDQNQTIAPVEGAPVVAAPAAAAPVVAAPAAAEEESQTSAVAPAIQYEITYSTSNNRQLYDRGIDSITKVESRQTDFTSIIDYLRTKHPEKVENINTMLHKHNLIANIFLPIWIQTARQKAKDESFQWMGKFAHDGDEILEKIKEIEEINLVQPILDGDIGEFNDRLSQLFRLVTEAEGLDSTGIMDLGDIEEISFLIKFSNNNTEENNNTKNKILNLMRSGFGFESGNSSAVADILISDILIDPNNTELSKKIKEKIEKIDINNKSTIPEIYREDFSNAYSKLLRLANDGIIEHNEIYSILDYQIKNIIVNREIKKHLSEIDFSDKDDLSSEKILGNIFGIGTIGNMFQKGGVDTLSDSTTESITEGAAFIATSLVPGVGVGFLAAKMSLKLGSLGIKAVKIDTLAERSGKMGAIGKGLKISTGIVTSGAGFHAGMMGWSNIVNKKEFKDLFKMGDGSDWALSIATFGTFRATNALIKKYGSTNTILKRYGGVGDSGEYTFNKYSAKMLITGGLDAAGIGVSALTINTLLSDHGNEFTFQDIAQMMGISIIMRAAGGKSMNEIDFLKIKMKINSKKETAKPNTTKKEAEVKKGEKKPLIKGDYYLADINGYRVGFKNGKVVEVFNIKKQKKLNGPAIKTWTIGQKNIDEIRIQSQKPVTKSNTTKKESETKKGEKEAGTISKGVNSMKDVKYK